VVREGGQSPRNCRMLLTAVLLHHSVLFLMYNFEHGFGPWTWVLMGKSRRRGIPKGLPGPPCS
jgi:hypothetical protein